MLFELRPLFPAGTVLEANEHFHFSTERYAVKLDRLLAATVLYGIWCGVGVIVGFGLEHALNAWERTLLSCIAKKETTQSPITAFVDDHVGGLIRPDAPKG